MMVKHLTETNSVYVERLQAYSSQFMSMTDLSTATYMGQTLIYNQLQAQAKLWAYVDSFRIFAVAGIIILFLIFLLKKDKQTTESKQ